MSLFNDKVAKLLARHEALLMRKNEPVEEGNGVIKISVKLKGYDDTSLLNKIIYGVN